MLVRVGVADQGELAGLPVAHERVLGHRDPELVRVERALRDSGRVVIRYSGTEPVARVMVEGQDPAQVRGHAENLARLIGAELKG